MNNLLRVAGSFDHEPNKAGGGARGFSLNLELCSGHLRRLSNRLNKILAEWESTSCIKDVLVDVEYREVVAKSNRIQRLLVRNADRANLYVRGARFDGMGESIHHTITYYIRRKDIKDTITELDMVASILDELYGGAINASELLKIQKKDSKSKLFETISRTAMVDVIADSYYVDDFHTAASNRESNDNSIVTLYETEKDARELLLDLGIDGDQIFCVSKNDFLMQPAALKKLYEDYGFLVSMSVSDVSEIYLESNIKSFRLDHGVTPSVPAPSNEPIVGVIDTLFSEDERIYIRDWVEVRNYETVRTGATGRDFDHGTAVSSLIVDAPSLNPELEDGCGRFRVRHFGVARSGNNSSVDIIRRIQEAVEGNPEIKVWNLSIGGERPIKKDNISPEAAVLDEIQSKYGVLFIVSGTNTSNADYDQTYIGAPADSLNSIVVNSVSWDKKPASYSRRGPVLSFFRKPDIAYYGGDEERGIRVLSSTNEVIQKCGTSFAAPLITRKAAYLMYKLGFDRNATKALIIDSALGWNGALGEDYEMGYGVPSLAIDDIIKTSPDEIKFVIGDRSEQYVTYNYNLPVPFDAKGCPYRAKAILCYTPYCSRGQGVDYTNTELTPSFGRILVNEGGKTKEGSVGKIIIKNIQNEPVVGCESEYRREAIARKQYRKWDNVKFICEDISKKASRKKVYTKDNKWGIKVKSMERKKDDSGDSIPFSLVVTLKEAYGKNRINDFINRCRIEGFFVQEIDNEVMNEVYNQASAEIEFES